MTRASSRNVSKLYTEHQVVHKGFLLFLYVTATEDVTSVLFMLETTNLSLIGMKLADNVPVFALHEGHGVVLQERYSTSGPN